MAHHIQQNSMNAPPLTSWCRNLITVSSGALAACAFLLGLSACGSEAPSAAPDASRVTTLAPGAGEERVGSVELSLQIGSSRLDSVSYTILGSGVVKSGSLDVSNSTRVSGVVGGIPFGKNYSLSMSGKAGGKAALDCSGSASFDVNGVGPTTVPIQIDCREPEVAMTPPAATPAPIPPFAVFLFACLLAGLGVVLQRPVSRH